jgi:hypothetical protein
MTITLPIYLISTQTILQAFINEKKEFPNGMQNKIYLSDLWNQKLWTIPHLEIQLADQLFMPNQLIHQNIFIKSGYRFLDH